VSRFREELGWDIAFEHRGLFQYASFEAQCVEMWTFSFGGCGVQSDLCFELTLTRGGAIRRVALPWLVL
jgi:hypothetical protein